MSINLRIGLTALSSYKRLAYTPWHAIAELIDNSTQSYINNKPILSKLPRKKTDPPLKVAITYDKKKGILTIEDNAMGMDYQEIEAAMFIATPTKSSKGRSRYGIGLKTSATWLGNNWKIITKKIHKTDEHVVTINLDSITKLRNKFSTVLPYEKNEGKDKESHYTRIEIRNLNKTFHPSTINKIKQFLTSMYRQDFRDNLLSITWNGEALSYTEIDGKLIKNEDGSLCKRDISFKIKSRKKTKTIKGWIGVFETGGRSMAGFAILHNGRVIKGQPEAWKPDFIFGDETNNLVNQRLVGELILDDFEVTHTKDDILWIDNEEFDVQTLLKAKCKSFIEKANEFRKGTRNLGKQNVSSALKKMQDELTDNRIRDAINARPLLSDDIANEAALSTIKFILKKKISPRFDVKVGDLNVKLYLTDEISSNDPYLSIQIGDPVNSVLIVVNSAHPFWMQLRSGADLLNFLRYCVYDGIAEWQASEKLSSIKPATIRTLKDSLLRLSYEISYAD